MSSIEDLFRFAKEGLVDEMRVLLEQPNVDINAKDTHSKGETALHCAARGGKRDTVEVLLEKGADVNARDNEGNTPLMPAARPLDEDTDREIAELLLSIENVEIDAKNDQGRTALIAAAMNGNYEVAKLLLKSNKVDINIQDNEGISALIWATVFEKEKVVKLLLHYGAFRGLKDGNGRTAQGVAQSLSTRGITRQRILALFGEFPDALPDEGIANNVSLLVDDHTSRIRENDIWWTVMGGQTTTKEEITPVDLSPPPKDRLRERAVGALERVKHAMWGEPDVSSPKRILSLDEDSNRANRWLWVHVPSNNILWVRWAIQHFPASYKMDDATNLIGMIDEALDEVRRSPKGRPVYYRKKAHEEIIVMPYLGVETAAFLDSRKDRRSLDFQPRSAARLRNMWQLVDDYGPQTKVKDQKNTMHIPQTLDQWNFVTDQPLEARDRDQVIYRYTKDAEIPNQYTEAKLLLVNQVWLWKTEDLVVTAFPHSWTGVTDSPLLDNLNYFVDEQKSIEDFVQHILSLCIVLPDESGYRGLGESENWASIFAKSVAGRGLIETERYKMFSGYIRGVSESNRLGREQPKDEAELDREFKALYDIYPETEGLRQVRDIRDELKMIGRVFEVQEAVLKGAFTNGHIREFDVTERQYTLKKIDKEAEGVERRFNQLLDLKQKQGSLNFARDADKRDKENEKQSQLLFVFTIITVIFTPLNFVAAFMAIPTKEFPHIGDNVNWRWWQSFVGMLVSEIMICVPAIWFWVKSAYGPELSKWNRERNTKTQESPKDAEVTKLSNKGDGFV